MKEEDKVPVTGKAHIEEDGDDNLSAPKHTIPNAASARIIWNRMRHAHIPRAKTFARIDGMIDGNAPFRKDLARRDGRQIRSNINFRDGEATKESVALAYWSLFNDVQYIFQVATDFGDPRQAAEIGQIVSEEFDRVLRDWEDFGLLMDQHQDDLVTYGLNFAFWPDERDWRFEVADIYTTLVPAKTRNRTQAITQIAIEHVMTAQELWDIYENSKSGKWDRKVLGQVLTSASTLNKPDEVTSDMWVNVIQTRIRNGDLCLDEIYNDDIHLVSIYFQEYDGEGNSDGISRGIFHPVFTGVSGSPGILKTDDWMFFSDRQYDYMCEAVQLFTFTQGKRHIHANKGIGHKIFNSIEGISRIDNSVLDSAIRSSTILVSTGASRNKDAKKIEFDLGGITDIGEAQFQQNLMGANLTSGIEAARYFRFKLDSNNNISGTSMNTPDGKPRTLGEVQFQVTREARVQKNRIAHYYRQLDSFGRSIFSKMLKSKVGWPGHDLVQLLKDRCIKRGVPEDFFKLTAENTGQNGLPEHVQLQATRASGSGSQFADQVEMQQVMNVLPTLGERGRENALKDYIAATRGHRYVDRYFPPEDRTKEPTSEDTLASIENNQLEQGEMVIVSPDNNHAVHAPRHLQRLQQIAQAFNEAESAAREAGSATPEVDAGEYGQYTLEEVDVSFQTGGPHFVRHLLYLQQDPTRKELARSLANQWAILANFGDKIANNAQEHRSTQIREMQKGQGQMDELDMKERVENRKIDVDANIKLRKLIVDSERASTRDRLQYLAQRMKVSLDHDVQKAKAVAELSMDAARTAEQEVNGKDNTALF